MLHACADKEGRAVVRDGRGKMQMVGGIEDNEARCETRIADVLPRFAKVGCAFDASFGIGWAAFLRGRPGVTVFTTK